MFDPQAFGVNQMDSETLAACGCGCMCNGGAGSGSGGGSGRTIDEGAQ